MKVGDTGYFALIRKPTGVSLMDDKITYGVAKVEIDRLSDASADLIFLERICGSSRVKFPYYVSREDVDDFFFKNKNKALSVMGRTMIEYAFKGVNIDHA